MIRQLEFLESGKNISFHMGFLKSTSKRKGSKPFCLQIHFMMLSS